MGLLEFSQKEYDYYVRRMTEALKLIGQNAYVRPVENETSNFYSDPSYINGAQVKANIIFDSNPQPILRKMGWNTEEDMAASLAWLGVLAEDNQYIEIRTGILIDVVSKYGPDTTQTFRVSRCKASSIHPTMYLVVLMPFKEQNDIEPSVSGVQSKPLPEKKETQFRYLQMDNDNTN